LQQHDRNDDQGEGRQQAEADPEASALAPGEDHQRPGEQRDEDGCDGQMIEPGGHWSRSRPSTWSVPVRPRAASRTTRKRAVVAKLMTMAVSTSACGRGSACRARSPTPPGSRIGGTPMRSPPVEKMKMFTAWERRER